MSNVFEAPGVWLRCALHAHTTNSDGELAPEMLVRDYERDGFDVLAITDHWVRTVERSTEDLLVLPAAELDALVGRDRAYAHVLPFGIEADPQPPAADFPRLDEAVEWVRGQGGAPYIAHTYWSGLRADDFEACEGILGLEVFNAGCELEIGRGLATLHWDEVLERGRACFAIATDDSHRPRYDGSLAWVWARCADRSSDAILAALRGGSFYSSTGPEILELSVDEAAVEVRCTPARSVTLLAGRAKGARANGGPNGYRHRAEVLATTSDDEIVAARLARPAASPYGRLQVEDGHGRTAWTNPLWP